MVETFARSSGQGQGSATVLSGMPNTMDTSTAGKGVENAFDEYKRDLAQKALKEEKLKKERDSIYSKINSPTMITPMGQAVVNKMFEDLVEDVRTGKQTEINKAVFEINNKAAELSVQEKDALKPLAIAEQNKLFLEQEGTYRPPTMIAPERFSKRDGATIEEFQSLLGQTLIDATSAVPKIEFDPNVAKGGLELVKKYYDEFGISEEITTDRKGTVVLATVKEKLPAEAFARLERELFMANRGNAVATLIEENGLDALGITKRSEAEGLTNFDAKNPNTGEVETFANIAEYIKAYSGIEDTRKTSKLFKETPPKPPKDDDKTPTEGTQGEITNPYDPYSILPTIATAVRQSGSKTTLQSVTHTTPDGNTVNSQIISVTETPEGEPAVVVERTVKGERRVNVVPVKDLGGQITEAQRATLMEEFGKIKGEVKVNEFAKDFDEFVKAHNSTKSTLSKDYNEGFVKKYLPEATDIEDPSWLGMGVGDKNDIKFVYKGETHQFDLDTKEGRDKFKKLIEDNKGVQGGAMSKF
jgi:hypothetical protein